MTDRDLIRVLLGTDHADPGCDEALVVLDGYVEAELEGRDAEALFPGIAEHLRNCSACVEDHAGLLALAREDDQL
jgi:hypothetical protein